MSNLALLSQPFPGETPLLFSPGLLSSDSLLEGTLTFNADVTEVYLAMRRPKGSHNIYLSKLENGTWSIPKPTNFSSYEAILEFHPHLTPDGGRLYFGSRRPLNKTENKPILRQWYVEKTGTDWGEPVAMKAPFEGRFIMRSTTAKNGNLYFTSREPGQKMEDEGIYRAINVAGQFEQVEKLGDEINAIGKWTAHPFIAPDESYLIFDAETRLGFEDCDLYVSFNKNGKWSQAQKLGPEINTELCEGGATVSPDGKYLFFGRYNKETGLSDPYWVSTSVIEKFRPQDF